MKTGFQKKSSLRKGVPQIWTFIPQKSLDNRLDAVKLAARQPQRSYQGRPGYQITASRDPIVKGIVE
jgi:predicted GNAT superfamily acetyltransferase